MEVRPSGKRAKENRIKIGLALGSGAAFGLAHIGALSVLEEAGINIDLIAGTSSGAVIGGLFALGMSSHDIYELAVKFGPRRLAFIDPLLPRTGLIGGRRIKQFLSKTIGRETRFSDLKIPFSCVATDIITGEEVVLDSGLVVEAIRASISIPVVLTVARIQGRYLVDGMLVNPVPVSLVNRMGSNYTIAVNVIPDTGERARVLVSTKIRHGEPNLVHILMQSVYIGTSLLTSVSLKGADAVIEPNVCAFGPGDFHHAEDIILEGRRAAARMLPEIQRGLAHVSGKPRRRSDLGPG